MHGNLFNITLKNVHNIKATHGNTPSPFKGEGEGSFDINRGTKKSLFQLKTPYSCPSASFASAKSLISFVSSSSIILRGSILQPPPLSASGLACQLPYHLFYPLPSIQLSCLRSLWLPLRLPSPCRITTLLTTGNESGNVNCKGPQGKARGGA